MANKNFPGQIHLKVADDRQCKDVKPKSKCVSGDSSSRVIGKLTVVRAPVRVVEVIKVVKEVEVEEEVSRTES